VREQFQGNTLTPALSRQSGRGTRHLALEMAPYGIYVNTVCPGPIETDLSKEWTEGYRKQLLSRIPLGRIGKPEEVAQVVLFLSSKMSDFITDESTNINGGLFMD